MPFDNTFVNPKLIGEFFTADLRDQRGQIKKGASLNLNTVLGNVNGKFKWRGRDFTATAQEISLNGSILTAKLKTNGNRYVSDQIDLSPYLKNDNGVLAASGADGAFDTGSSTSTGPPPAYPRNSRSAKYRSFMSTKVSQESRSSTYFMYSVPTDKLRLQGSILHAECLRLDGTYMAQTLDLDDYIGIVNGHLIWGRTKFSEVGKNIKLQGYFVHAECRDESNTVVSSSIDLSRYLHSYDGILSVKVTVESPELTSLLSDARWMKFKVVTEPDASVVIGGNSAFKSAFSSLAESTSKHVMEEMTELMEDSAGDDIKDALADKVKAEMTRLATDAMSAELRQQLMDKVEETFATAKQAVVDTCNEMIDAAVNKVTIQCVDSVSGPLGDQLAEQCNFAIMKAVEDVTSAAIAHYQERVEILMEREMMMASTRRARTQAAFLAMYKELSVGGVWEAD